jgi:hypothetical protein
MYEGAWQISSTRDIDPSFLLRKTNSDRWSTFQESWWCPYLYSAWVDEKSDEDWLTATDDLPVIEQFLITNQPSTNKCWLALSSNVTWEQPLPFELDDFSQPKRQLLYRVRAYIVSSENSDAFYEWSLVNNTSGMPSSRELHKVFFGELFRSEAYDYHNCYYFSQLDWVEEEHYPTPFRVPNTMYMWEGNGYDCSVDETFHIYIPSGWLANDLHLSWRGHEGHFYDQKNDLIAFDPSVEEYGPSTLLVHKETFSEYLEKNKYELIWCVSGEKRIVSGRVGSNPGYLEIFGAFRYRENRLEGTLKTNYIKRN